MSAPALTLDCTFCRGSGQEELEEDALSDSSGSYLVECNACDGTGAARCFQCGCAIATVVTAVGGTICAGCEADGYGVTLPLAATVTREGHA